MSKFAVSRSILIRASIEEVYTAVRDLRKWKLWSPWLIAEPDCQFAVADDARSYHWEGNVIGAGALELEKEEPNRALEFQLNFLKPWKSTAEVRFLFEQQEEAVEVTWSMTSVLPFFMFWMKSTIIGMIGMDYRRGLMMLKDLVELGEIPSKLDFLGKVPTPYAGSRYVGIQSTASIADLGERMQADFGSLADWLEEKGITPSDRMLSIYHDYDIVKDHVQYTAAAPIDSAPGAMPQGFATGDIPPHQTFAIRHTGPYRHLGNAWSAGMLRERAHVFRANKKIHSYEAYQYTPGQIPENELVTTVHFPVS